MKLVFRSHPALEPYLPKPMPAKAGLPDWLRKMPGQARSEILAETVRTLKHCPPFIDAMGHGVLMPLACDLSFGNGRFTWQSDLPTIPGSLSGRSPIAVHVPEQATGTPYAADQQFIVKFLSYWSIEAPDGWSVFFCHPINRADLPFQTLAGLVDCDLFKDGLVHFPAVWQAHGFHGTLAKGTPVAQCFPVLREAVELIFETLDTDEIASQEALRAELQNETGVYRKRYHGSR